MLDLRVAAAVWPLLPGELAEEAEVLAQSPGGEEVGFLRKLEVVVNDLMPGVVQARGVDVGHFGIQRERDIAREVARPDHLRPHSLVGLRAERDRLLLDLLLGFLGHVVAVQPERLPEGVQLGEDRVARLTRGLVLAGECGHRARRLRIPENQSRH